MAKCNMILLKIYSFTLFTQGRIERANVMIKRTLPGKKMTIFQLILVLEFVIFHINRRPLYVEKVSMLIEASKS